jgi:Flp pilus assembly protein TadD
LSAKGDYAGAIRECREALRLGTHAAELYSLMGSAFVKQGQSEEGERCYRAATEADPHFPMSWYNWATLCFQQSRYVEASRLFRKALAVHSVHVESWSGLGWSLELAGEPHEAAVCYRRALQIDPSLVVVSTRLADLLATSGDTSLRAPTEALRIVEPLAKQTRGRNPHILDTLAAALAANGRCPEAVRVVEAALKLSPDKGLRARLESRLAAYRAGKPIETIAPDQTVSADQAGSSEQSVSLSGDSVSGENSPPSQSVSPEEGR